MPAARSNRLKPLRIVDPACGQVVEGLGIFGVVSDGALVEPLRDCDDCDDCVDDETVSEAVDAVEDELVVDHRRARQIDLEREVTVCVSRGRR